MAQDFERTITSNIDTSFATVRAASNSDDDKKFFYWLFEPDFADSSVGHNGDDDIPLLIWLNGGPGCSSMVRKSMST